MTVDAQVRQVAWRVQERPGAVRTLRGHAARGGLGAHAGCALDPEATDLIVGGGDVLAVEEVVVLQTRCTMFVGTSHGLHGGSVAVTVDSGGSVRVHRDLPRIVDVPNGGDPGLRFQTGVTNPAIFDKKFKRSVRIES